MLSLSFEEYCQFSQIAKHLRHPRQGSIVIQLSSSNNLHVARGVSGGSAAAAAATQLVRILYFFVIKSASQQQQFPRGQQPPRVQQFSTSTWSTWGQQQQQADSNQEVPRAERVPRASAVADQVIRYPDFSLLYPFSCKKSKRVSTHANVLINLD